MDPIILISLSFPQTGTGLHWMKGNLDKYQTKGPEAAIEDFQDHMKNLVPQLDKLTASSNIVIQLQDHIQVK